MPLFPIGIREGHPDVKNKTPCYVDVRYSDDLAHETFDCIGMIVVGDTFQRRSSGDVYTITEFTMVDDPVKEGVTLVAQADMWSTAVAT